MLPYSPSFPAEPQQSESDLQSRFSEWEAELPALDAASASACSFVDVTALAREAWILPPTAITFALWADIAAIPPGFEPEETVQGRLWTVLRHAWLAVLHLKAAGRANDVEDELLVFPVCLPAVGQEISDYPVVLLYRCSDAGGPTLTLMTPEEAASALT